MQTRALVSAQSVVRVTFPTSLTLFTVVFFDHQA